MEIQIVKKEKMPDASVHYKMIVQPRDLIILGYLLESLEGWSYYTTIDKKENIFSVEVIKAFTEKFELFLEDIKRL